jgi:hypothetical protein
MVTADGVFYRIEFGTSSIGGSSEVDVALEVLDSKIRSEIALHARDHIFLHAGAVGYRGRMIVIPGMTFSGKTTLVSELVRLGAEYYSDEFAPLDADGRVHPYPKALSVRAADGSASQVDRPVSELGGTVGFEPLPVGVVTLSPYSPGASWNPTELSRGEALLALLANAVPAEERPEQSMSAISRAVENAIVLEGARGEASEVARELLARL